MGEHVIKILFRSIWIAQFAFRVIYDRDRVWRAGERKEKKALIISQEQKTKIKNFADVRCMHVDQASSAPGIERARGIGNETSKLTWQAF